jgi:hypothetical protein
MPFDNERDHLIFAIRMVSYTAARVRRTSGTSACGLRTAVVVLNAFVCYGSLDDYELWRTRIKRSRLPSEASKRINLSSPAGARFVFVA